MRWTLENKIQSFLDKRSDPDENECIKWLGTFQPNGYGRGQLKVGDYTYFGAHRVAYFIKYGEFNHELLVCHTCDNRWCINIEHLFLGTNADNSADMVAKGRTNNPWLGKKHTEETKEKLRISAKERERKRRENDYYL